MRTCINPACENRFNPQHRGHFWCNSFCFTSHKETEMTYGEAGMLNGGGMGDRAKIQAFIRKWSRKAGKS